MISYQSRITNEKFWMSRAERFRKGWIRALRAVAVEGILFSMNFDYSRYFERRPRICGGELVVKDLHAGGGPIQMRPRR
jgi:hypothetical protein